MDGERRERILDAAYRCVARRGLARSTLEDVAREAGVSRATVYREFPGGRDEVMGEMIAHETDRFFLDLAVAVAEVEGAVPVLEEALVHAHRAVEDHHVLQMLVRVEPDRLLPALTAETTRLLPEIARFVEPYLATARLRPGIAVAEAAEYVARMFLSLIASQGRWDLTDRRQVAELVRTELLGGVVVGEVEEGDG